MPHFLKKALHLVIFVRIKLMEQMIRLWLTNFTKLTKVRRLNTGSHIGKILLQYRYTVWYGTTVSVCSEMAYQYNIGTVHSIPDGMGWYGIPWD